MLEIGTRACFWPGRKTPSSFVNGNFLVIHNHRHILTYYIEACGCSRTRCDCCGAEQIVECVRVGAVGGQRRRRCRVACRRVHGKEMVKWCVVFSMRCSFQIAHRYILSSHPQPPRHKSSRTQHWNIYVFMDAHAHAHLYT